MGIANIEARFKVSVYHREFDSDRFEGETKRTCYCKSYEEADHFFYAECIMLRSLFTGRYEEDQWGDCVNTRNCLLVDDDDLFIIKLEKIVSD